MEGDELLLNRLEFEHEWDNRLAFSFPFVFIFVKGLSIAAYTNESFNKNKIKKSWKMKG